MPREIKRRCVLKRTKSSKTGKYKYGFRSRNSEGKIVRCEPSVSAKRKHVKKFTVSGGKAHRSYAHSMYKARLLNLAKGRATRLANLNAKKVVPKAQHVRFD